MSIPSDKILIKGYINGNEQALEILISRHKDRVYNYIFNRVRDHEKADDVFQDTFIKVINTVKKGSYNEEGKFLPWVLRIAHNLVIDGFRKEKKVKMIRPTDEFDIFDTIKGDNKNAEEFIVSGQVKDKVQKLIERLPEEQKEVLMMRHYYGLSFNEISEETGVSINTALGRMRYALMNLRKMIEEKNIQLMEF